RSEADEFRSKSLSARSIHDGAIEQCDGWGRPGTAEEVPEGRGSRSADRDAALSQRCRQSIPDHRAERESKEAVAYARETDVPGFLHSADAADFQPRPSKREPRHEDRYARR